MTIGSFAATGQSANFIPNPLPQGVGFNVSIYGTFVASIQLERSFDNGANWLQTTAGGAAFNVWTAPCSESVQETSANVLYRLNCTAYTSGTANYRMDQ